MQPRVREEKCGAFDVEREQCGTRDQSRGGGKRIKEEEEQNLHQERSQYSRSVTRKSELDELSSSEDCQ